MHHTSEHSECLTAIKGIIYFLMRNGMHEVDNVIAFTEPRNKSQYTSSQDKEVSFSRAPILNNIKCDTII